MKILYNADKVYRAIDKGKSLQIFALKLLFSIRRVSHFSTYILFKQMTIQNLNKAYSVCQMDLYCEHEHLRNLPTLHKIFWQVSASDNTIIIAE